jgi:hypothetical protein
MAKSATEAKTLALLTQGAAVTKAIDEFDRIGRSAFLSKYGFRAARSYFLVHKGRRYDSKAIAGAAIGYEHPHIGPLSAADFVGGDATVRPKLQSLGFEVVANGSADENSMPERFSDVLQEGKVYSREDLASRFRITDATLNTGVFQPKGSRSIWLFVTLQKASDRIQYHDLLEGDVLHWQGQTSGRSDARIVNHEADGNELLVFYRKSKQQHPHAGFDYEGSFRYLRHEPGKPSNFVLQRLSASREAELETTVEPFDPADIEGGRRKVLSLVARRQGQPKFRRDLMVAYEGRCAITGCPVEAVLEAAHIHPYQGQHTNDVSNGLLLRADLHTLFDLKLLWIDEMKRVTLSQRLEGTPYWELHGAHLRVPKQSAAQPSLKALQWHREQVQFG